MKRTLLLTICFYAALNVLFGQTNSTRLNEILEMNGDRPMIVEFFSSGCIVCFQGLPHLQQIKDQFGDELNVLLIGMEDGKIQDTYGKYKKKFNLDIPVVFDSLIPKEIGVKIYPTVLWIKNGKIAGKTYSDALTTDNLRSFLDGSITKERLTIIKTKFRGDTLYVSNSRPLLQTGLFPANERTPIFIPTSLKNSKLPGSFQTLNVTIEQLYKYAYFSRSLWGVGDSMYGKVHSKVLFEDSSYSQKNRYCYTVTLPAPQNSISDIQQQMRQDLQKAFNYKASIETRLIPCWKLIALQGAEKKLATKGGRLNQIHTHARISLVNSPVEDLVKALAYKLPSPYPYINATGFTHNIDLDIEAVLLDFEEFRKGLLRFGLDIVKDEMPMQVLVLRKNTAAPVATVF